VIFKSKLSLCPSIPPLLLQQLLQHHTTTATMPKFFCDYCDVYLTHDSMSVRKAHNSGRNHLRNVVDYYQAIGHEKAQNVIDSITNSYNDAGQSGSNPMLQNAPGMPGMPGMGPPGKSLLQVDYGGGC